MRKPARAGALLAILFWAGCGSGSDPAELDAAALVKAIAEAQAQAVAEAAPAAPEPDGPIAKAPTIAEVLKGCPIGEKAPSDALRSAAKAGDFAKLDELLQGLHAAHRETVACEDHLWVAISILDGFDFELLDRWVAARPDSWAAFTARGSKWLDAGYERRGNRLSKDVTKEQWEGMYEAIAHAESDLMRALEIEPNGFVAYGKAIYRVKAGGESAEVRKWLDALLARDPHNVGVRWMAMGALSPWWGGSIEAMRAIADDAQRFADQNPRLRILPGYAEAEAAKVHRFAKRHAEAAAGYRRALAHGDFADWHRDLIRSLDDLEDWNGVVAAADAWLAELGEETGPHLWRGRALEALGKLPQAIEEYDRAVALSPHYAYLLRARCSALRRAGRAADAAVDLRHALEHEESAFALNELVLALQADPAQAAATEELARGLTAKHPEDAGPWFLLGSVLQARGAPEARAVLERYVALARNDGDESAQLARARRMLDPRPDARTLPALQHFGLSRPEVAAGAAPGRS